MAMQPPARSSSHPRSAANAGQRRHNTNASKLPSSPRFHPANFPSSHSSVANTPATGPNSPQPPVSPRSQRNMYSDAQKQSYLYQRETLASHRGAMSPRSEKPTSPRLEPLGSPGPVTPLESEGSDGYLVAGAKAAGRKEATHAEQLVDKSIQEEQRRSHSRSPSFNSR